MLEFFHKHKGRKDGLNNLCKICACEKKKKEYASNEQLREQKKQYRKDYDQKNSESVLANKKRYYQEHQEEILEQKKQYHQDNKEVIAEKHKTYYENNKEYFIAAAAKRRAAQFDQTPEYANTDLIALIYKHRPDGYHVDHMMPLVRGGLHHESNLCYLPASINMSKASRTIEEFGTQEFCQHVIYWQDLLGCAYNSFTESV